MGEERGSGSESGGSPPLSEWSDLEALCGSHHHGTKRRRRDLGGRGGGVKDTDRDDGIWGLAGEVAELMPEGNPERAKLRAAILSHDLENACLLLAGALFGKMLSRSEGSGAEERDEEGDSDGSDSDDEAKQIDDYYVADEGSSGRNGRDGSPQAARDLRAPTWQTKADGIAEMVRRKPRGVSEGDESDRFAWKKAMQLSPDGKTVVFNVLPDAPAIPTPDWFIRRHYRFTRLCPGEGTPPKPPEDVFLWSKFAAMAPMRPWPVPPATREGLALPPPASWGSSPFARTREDVARFLTQARYFPVRWPRGTLLAHGVHGYGRDRPGPGVEREGCCTFFHWDWPTIRQAIAEEAFGKSGRWQFLVLQRNIAVPHIHGWSDSLSDLDNNRPHRRFERYFYPPTFMQFFGARAPGQDEHERGFEFLGNQAMFDLGFAGRCALAETEMMLTRPLALGVEVDPLMLAALFRLHMHA